MCFLLMLTTGNIVWIMVSNRHTDVWSMGVHHAGCVLYRALILSVISDGCDLISVHYSDHNCFRSAPVPGN